MILAAAGVAAALVAPAWAVNLVQNGGFTSNNGLNQFNYGEVVTDWSVPTNQGDGYAFLFQGTTADTSGSGAGGSQYGAVGLWGPANGSNNGYVPPPGSPFFVGLDSDYESAPIQQDISGLVSGQKYTVNFVYAFAQQYWFTGPTSQYWMAQLGNNPITWTPAGLNGSWSTNNQYCTTATVSLPSEGFSGWASDSCTFTATGASEWLSFMAWGNIQVPPFALLTDVSMNADVPEPSTWALLIAGLLGMMGFAAWRRGRTS